jgi:magnesium transporter
MVFRHRRTRPRHAPGTPPGTLKGHPEASRALVRVACYGADRLVEETAEDPGRLEALKETAPVMWVDVSGSGDAETVARIGETFGLHPLATEDVLNTRQRAKVERYGDQLFIVARSASRDPGQGTEQMSMFLGPGWVLTFQEDEPDLFEPVRARLREGRLRIRAAGPDYLAYAVLDTIIDHYFPALEHFAERLDELEGEVLDGSADNPLATIQSIRRGLLDLRRAVWPLRDALNALLRDEAGSFAPETHVYLRDCYDHTIQIMDLIETYRELAAGLLDLYMSMVGNRMNEIMKTLTIMATIFIPLSFVAGLYGMNFDREVSPWNMPELGWYLGYPFALVVMAGVAGGLLLYFRRKGWLGG